MNQYSMLIQWSEEDQLFLITIPEFSDDLRSVVDHRVIMPCTHGKTRELHRSDFIDSFAAVLFEE
ncbi:MAG: hypothetical protein HC860_14735 [Alkalinema sp. RU_4_3]|nr:hypothetical protein [Alkalinema sp. RU_4_3]